MIENELRQLTDLQFMNHWIDACYEFINPFLLRELNRRGLYSFVNKLQGNKQERRAELYARLAKSGKVFGDAEIDQIASVIRAVEDIQKRISDVHPTDVAELIELTRSMQVHLEFIRDYFKKPSVLL